METRSIPDLVARRGEVTLVDVRTRFEFSGGHISGAVHMPLGALRPAELSGDVWVICRSGARSEQACRQLEAAGLQVTNVQGGMMAWSAAGHPVEGGRGLGSLAMPALASLTLGLAPFTPEPHILGKLRWVAGGADGMALLDWGDLLMHGAPWAWLIWAGVSLARR